MQRWGKPLATLIEVVKAGEFDKALLAAKTLLLFGGLAYTAIGLLYIPMISALMNFLTESGSKDRYTLDLSIRFFWELFGRWGNGTAWSMAYAVTFSAGVVAVVQRRDLSLSLILWFAAPFLVLAFVPSKSMLFDIRYLAGALPAFILLIAAGVVSIAAVGQRLAVRAWGAPWMRTAEFRAVLIGCLVLSFGALSMDTYGAFRATQLRCSKFFRFPELLHWHEGFCQKHIMLNSLDPEYSSIWKKRGGGAD